MGKNLDCSMWRMQHEPEGAGTIGWEEWSRRCAPSRNELRAEEGEVGADFKNAGFMVQVGKRCHTEGASGYPKGRILDGLEGSHSRV